MTDPRDANCREFNDDAGKVVGVNLTHVPRPDSKYALIKASLIDENLAQGTTVARVIVKDANGIDATVRCWLAWPWTGALGRFDNRGLPGNADYPYQHMITNKYDPPGQGPLVIYIGDANGKIESDVIAGLGLPGGHHVSYHLVFQERTADTPPDPPIEPDPDPGAPADDDIKEVLQRIEAKLNRLAKHFGIDD